MVIIGITGAIHHGKTSFGEALQAIAPHATHYESSQVITDLAEKWLQSKPPLLKPDNLVGINDWLSKLLPIIKRDYGLGVTMDQVRLTPKKIAADPQDFAKLFAYLEATTGPATSLSLADKENYRPLLQWLGGYLYAHVDDGIWYDHIIDLINQDHANGIVLSTVGGLRFLRDAEIIKKAGGVIVAIQRPDMQEIDLADPTERSRSDIQPDSTVRNDGSLADLQNCARLVYQDILAERLKPKYSATQATAQLT